MIAAANDLGAYLIGIGALSSAPTAQMTSLAAATGSYADTDGNGYADNPLVFYWSGSSTTLGPTIVKAIQDLTQAVKFDRVSLSIDGDQHGFVTRVDPASYAVDGTVSGEVIDFTLTFRGAVAATEEDQIFNLTLNVLGDDSILLDSLDIVVVVPGRT